MGQFDVRIPDYNAPDIGGPLQSIATHFDDLRKMQNDQRNTDRKLSADAARVKWEQDQKTAEQKQADDIARANMLAPDSPLMRAAGNPNMSPAQLNAMGAPYGITFDGSGNQTSAGTSSAADTGAAIHKMFNPALGSPVVPGEGQSPISLGPLGSGVSPIPPGGDAARAMALPNASAPSGKQNYVVETPTEEPKSIGYEPDQWDLAHPHSAWIDRASDSWERKQTLDKNGNPPESAAMDIRAIRDHSAKMGLPRGLLRMVDTDDPNNAAQIAANKGIAFNPDTDQVGDSSNPDISALTGEIAAKTPTTTRHMFATVNGQRFEVQKSQDSTGLGEKYDTLYHAILPHVGEAKAMALVIAKAEKDNTIQATADAIGSRRTDKMADDEKYRLTADEQKHLRSQPLDNAEREKLAAIRNGGGAGMPMPDPKAMQAWLAVHKEGKTSSLAVQAVRNRQIFDRLATEMDQGQVPNAVSQKMALHSLATLSTSMGGTGARVAVQIVNDINNANGLIDSVENKLYQARNHGQNMPQIMSVYRNAGARLRQLNDTISRQVYDSVDAQSGNKSAFAQVPQLAPIVSGAMRGFKMDLGLPDDEQPGGGGAPPPPATQTMPPQAAAALQSYIRSAQPGDPKAEQAKATLRAHGYPE